MAWLGLAWLGLAWLGLAWLGMAWHGLAGLGWAGLGWARLRCIARIPLRADGGTCCDIVLAEHGSFLAAVSTTGPLTIASLGVVAALLIIIYRTSPAARKRSLSHQSLAQPALSQPDSQRGSQRASSYASHLYTPPAAVTERPTSLTARPLCSAGAAPQSKHAS